VRAKDSARKRAAAATARLVIVPPCEHRRRRDMLEQNLARWLRWYFHHIFTDAFTEQQLAMIEALRAAVVHGGDQAIAASRGEGKTTLCECVLAWSLLTGQSRFAVLFSATGGDAENSLATWKALFIDDESKRLQADYPEVCTPVAALENTPNRAHYQLISGNRHDTGEPYGPVSSKFQWCGRRVQLPKVPGAPGSRGIFATRGLDAAVRGLKVGNQRPDVAVIDDPDTDETVNSSDQAAKLVRKIERNIAGLAGQKRPMARVMLTTIQRTECVSAWYTDPAQKPTWKGQRHRFMVKPPANLELWEEYQAMRLQALEQFASGQGDDEHARGAHQFYIDNRAEMDRGHEVANPNRYDQSTLPDGSQAELSAVQAYYNLVARLGAEAVATEYDNSPPEEAAALDTGLTAYRVQHQVSGYPRKRIPPGVVCLTAGIDVRKIALHWTVRAWEINGTGYTIDYGIQEVHGTVVGSDEGLDLAIRRTILERMEDWQDSPYVREGGEQLPIKLALVDAGWRTEAVYLATEEWGHGLMPAMGFGRSGGCAKPNFSDGQGQTATRRSGDGWFMSHRPTAGQGVWLVGMDADRWKAWEHDRWLTDPGQVGAMHNHGAPTDPKNRDHRKRHFAYSKHITAEAEVEEIVDGRLKRYWMTKSDNNHYLDASYMANVAANICGVKLLRNVKQTAAKQPTAATAPAAAAKTKPPPKPAAPPAQTLEPPPAKRTPTRRPRGGGRPGGNMGRNRW